MPENPDDLHSRLDPPDMNTSPFEAAPKTPAKPMPNASDYLNEGPGTMPLPSANPADTPYTLPLPSVEGTGSEKKPSGFFKSVDGLKTESEVQDYQEGGVTSGLHKKAAPTMPTVPPVVPPTQPIHQKVVITADVEKPIRRGKGILGILIGLLQFLFGLLLIGLLIASIAPMMADYDGPVGDVGVQIRDLVLPYALDICDYVPVNGCFGYIDLPPEEDTPESSHENMPGLCNSPCDPAAATSTCAEGLSCLRDATGAGYCYSATSPLCEVTATPSTSTQTTTGGSTTSGTSGGTTDGGQPTGNQTDDPCKDHGGVADINPSYCSCQSITYTVITCQDGFKIESPNAGSTCNPDPANCQQPTTTGGGDGGGTTPVACEYVCYVKDRTGKCTQGAWVYPGTDRVCDPRNP